MSYKKGSRRAVVSENYIGDGYSVSFYYDGLPHYNAIKGCQGVNCKQYKTKKAAKAAALRYVKKK